MVAITISYPTSASGIIVLLKNAHKKSRIFPDFICKHNRFSSLLVSLALAATQKMKGFLFYLSVGPKSSAWSQAFLTETVETGDKYPGMSKARQGRLMRKM